MSSRFPVPVRRSIAASAFGMMVLSAQSDAQIHGRALFDSLIPGRYLHLTGPRFGGWLADGSYFVIQRDPHVPFVRIDPRTGAARPVFDSATVATIATAYSRLNPSSQSQSLPFREFSFAGADRRAIVFTADRGQYLYNLLTRQLYRLPPDLTADDSSVAGLVPTRSVVAPTYDYVAFVRHFDLYTTRLADGVEHRLTNDGSEAAMNGRLDAQYDEFGQHAAIWWSPDGRRIGYLQLNEAAVDRFPLIDDTTPVPRVRYQRYTVPGRPLPSPRLFVINVMTGERVGIETDSTVRSSYLLNSTWSPDGRWLFFEQVNREQTRLELRIADAVTGASRVLVREDAQDFVNVRDDLRVLRRRPAFLWASERDGARQLYLYGLDGRLLRQLTSGDPVANIVGIDESAGWLYYTTFVNDGLETQLFRVQLDGGHREQLTHEPGIHDVWMDPTSQYYLDSFSSRTVPPRLHVAPATGGRGRLVSSYDASALNTLGILPPELLVLPAADPTVQLHAALYRPAGFRPQQQYPLLLYVYGGPHGRLVRDVFDGDGIAQRFAQLGFLVLAIDNRGTIGRGKRFEASTFQHLGGVDVEDQITATWAFVRSHADAVDSSRVGVFGASYGGYLTLMAMAKAPELFQAGVALAPVTDWHLYDAAYTERYLRTPQSDSAGYERGSVLNHIASLRGALLIIHGMADENVHVQHSLSLIRGLTAVGRPIHALLYPELSHSAAGTAGVHALNAAADFLTTHLISPETPVEGRGSHLRSSALRDSRSAEPER